MGTDYKLIPYGISNFKQVRSENKYLVDKTMYFEKMEQAGNFLFLVRPRRFGKSLFLNMLEAYYDVNEKYGFEELFRGLYVADHPTENRNKYQVMHLDFSLVGSDVERLQENFDFYLSMRCDSFARKYARFYPDGFVGEVRRLQHGEQKLNYINVAAHTAGCPLYLVVDEYDNFTNNVLNIKGHDAYHALTHGTGFYRDVFKLFKGMFDRIIMLGVSPITLDDLTSGYNIATNITADAAFNHMLGFSEDEVRKMFEYYSEAGLLKGDIDAMIQEMKPWYDNYCFAKEGLSESRVFNSNMVLYYLSTRIAEGHAPREMTDPNARTDYQKMKRLIQLDRLEPQRKSIIYKIAEEGYIFSRLVPYFPASEMVKFDNFVSLLYYYGMLTITGVRGDKLRLGIPNNNVRKQYYGYLTEEYDRIRPADHWRIDEAYQAAALSGDWQPLVKTISEEYEKTCAVRCLIEGERNLQGFFTAYLNMTNYYLTAPELELSHGYCDFFLLPDLSRYPMVAHSYILELKYLKQDATAEEAEAQWAEAVSQITRYAQDEKVRLLCGPTQLHLIVAQYRGYQLVRLEEVNA